MTTFVLVMALISVGFLAAGIVALRDIKDDPKVSAFRTSFRLFCDAKDFQTVVRLKTRQLDRRADEIARAHIARPDASR